MGRIGKSYPRFEHAPQPAQPPAQPSDEAGTSLLQVLGAAVGVLCALGFIGWLLAR